MTKTINQMTKKEMERAIKNLQEKVELRKQMPKENSILPIFLRDVISITIHQEVIEIQTDHKTFEITGFGDNIGLDLNWKDDAIEHVLAIH